MLVACWITKSAVTLRICNMYCSSTSRMVARMGLSVTFCLHCVFCLLTSRATKQVRASYPAPSFRWFLSPLPHPATEPENGVRYSCILVSRIWVGELVFFVVGKFSPSTLFLKTSNRVVLCVSFVDACP
jgi:hypothetical protein